MGHEAEGPDADGRFNSLKLAMQPALRVYSHPEHGAMFIMAPPNMEIGVLLATAQD